MNRVALKHLGSVAAVMLMLLAAQAAHADNLLPAPGGNSTWTVYAFGNAQAVSDAFRALFNFSQSGTFKSIISLIAVTGAIVIGLSSGFSPAVAKKFISYCMGVFMVIYAFFGMGKGPLTVNVDVMDTVDMTWVAPVTLPAVIGIPAAVVSTAGMEITRQIEASFPLPDSMKMSNGAPFNLPASMLADATKARITDSNLSASLAYYVQDCFIIGVANGVLNVNTLVNSTDFLNDMRYDNKALMVNTLSHPDFEGIDSIVSCADAWSFINTRVNSEGDDAAAFLKKASAWAATPALSVVNAGADAAFQWSSNNGITNGGSAVKQAAVLGAFNHAYKNAASQTGNSEMLTGLGLAQAYESQRSGWILGAEVFNRMMGYIYAVIQVFVYAVLPLVLASSLIPGLGFALLKNFLQIVLWLAIWPPMLAIVNFVIVSMQRSELGGALAGSQGLPGVTMVNMGIVSEKAANLQAAATFIGTMVPMLAWSMVKGTVDFSRVIGSAVGENFTAQAANTGTTGNFSLNQGSMDSFTANKTSLSSNSAFGQFTNSDGIGSRKMNAGGVEAAGNGAAVSLMTSRNLANTDSNAVTDAGNKSTMGSYAKSGTTGSGHTDAGGNGTIFADAQASVAGTSAQGGGSVGLRSGGGGGAKDGDGTRAQSASEIKTDGKATDAERIAVKPTNLVKQGLEAVKDTAALVNPTAGVNVHGSRTKQFSLAQQHSNQATGVESVNGTEGHTATDTAGTVQNAQKSRQTQVSDGLVHNRATGGQAYADMLHNYFHTESSADWLTGSKNPEATGFTKGLSAEGIQTGSADLRKETAGNYADYKGQGEKLRGHAAEGYDLAQKKARSEINLADANVDSKKGDANEGAISRAVTEGKEVTKETMTELKDFGGMLMDKFFGSATPEKPSTPTDSRAGGEGSEAPRGQSYTPITPPLSISPMSTGLTNPQNTGIQGQAPLAMGDTPFNSPAAVGIALASANGDNRATTAEANAIAAERAIHTANSDMARVNQDLARAMDERTYEGMHQVVADMSSLNAGKTYRG